MGTKARPHKEWIVAVDDVAECAPAVRAGWRLAAQLEAPVRFIHAAPIAPPLWPGLDEAATELMNRETLAAARSRLLEFLERELPEVGREKLASHLVVDPGKAAHVLAREAASSGASTIVVGKHHRRGLLDFGRTLRGVLSVAPCSVWVQVGEPVPIERILVPVDFSTHSESALADAIVLAGKFGASVHLMHFLDISASQQASAGTFSEPVWPERGDEVEQAAKELLDKLIAKHGIGGVRVSSEISEEAALEGILERQHDHDLIVMGTHGRTGLARAVLGSVAYEVLRHARVPGLAVRADGADFLS